MKHRRDYGKSLLSALGFWAGSDAQSAVAVHSNFGYSDRLEIEACETVLPNSISHGGFIRLHLGFVLEAPPIRVFKRRTNFMIETMERELNDADYVKTQVGRSLKLFKTKEV